MYFLETLVTEKDTKDAEIGSGLSLPPVSNIHDNNSFKRAQEKKLVPSNNGYGKMMKSQMEFRLKNQGAQSVKN